MLQIENVADRELTTLRVSGNLTGSDVPQLEQAWEGAKSSPVVRVDLCAVTSIDCRGQELLKRMFSDGAQFSVASHGPRFCCNQSSPPLDNDRSACQTSRLHLS
jgi:ABC-type transporter Mla MlaB component